MNEVIQSGEKISMLKGLSDGLIRNAKKHKNMMVLHADFGTKLGLKNFCMGFPERCFNFGLSEENVVSASVGFSVKGKIPFVLGFANFAGKAWEQIRSSVCYPNLNVKFVATNAGIAAGEDGVGYQATEDIALMRVIPNMKVISPADYYETLAAVEEAFDSFGPVYIRLASGEVPVIFDENFKFEFGKAKVLREGRDVCVFALGTMVYNSLRAAEILEGSGVSVKVVDMASIKPLDAATVIDSAKNAKVCVVIEDHNLMGGLFSAVSEVFAENGLGNLKKIGLDDRFGESGNAMDLYRKYGLDVEGIVGKIREFL